MKPKFKLANILHPHHHTWHEIIYIYPHDRCVVRYCKGCDAAMSLVHDVRAHEDRWIDGDIWFRDEIVFIIADNNQMFQTFKRQLQADGVTMQQIVHLTDMEKIRGLKNPIILFTGDWWEQEVVHDPRFTEYLNTYHI
jgi:hypothetical protein